MNNNTDNTSGEYKKVSIKKVLKEPVSEADVNTIKAAILGYGNRKIVADTAEVSAEAVRGIVTTKTATPEILKRVLGAIQFINTNKATA